MAAAPPLPTIFPCWCRAIYSWGGERKQDLGFIEGDLIECLNAGDGSWWMGRLRRDKRMAGLFPSNFVEVLPESAVAQLSSSATTLANRSDGSRSPSPQKPVNNRSWRKPFQAYANATGPNTPTSATQPNSTPAGSVREKRSLRPYASMKTVKAPEGNSKSGRPEEDQAWIPAPISRESDIDSARPTSRARPLGSISNRPKSSSISSGHGQYYPDSRNAQHDYNGPYGSFGGDRYDRQHSRDRYFNGSDSSLALSRPRSSAALFREDNTSQQPYGSQADHRPEMRHYPSYDQATGPSGRHSGPGSAMGHGSVRGSIPPTPASAVHPRSNSAAPYDSESTALPGGTNLHPQPGQGWLNRKREMRNSQRQPPSLGHMRSRSELGHNSRDGTREYYQEQQHHDQFRQQGRLDYQPSGYQADSYSRGSVPPGQGFSYNGSLVGRPGSAMGRPMSSRGNSVSRPGSSLGRPSSAMGLRPGSSMGRGYGPPPVALMDHRQQLGGLSRPSSSMGLRPGSGMGPNQHQGRGQSPLRQPFGSIRQTNMNEQSRERSIPMYSNSNPSPIQNALMKMEDELNGPMDDDSPPPPPPHRQATFGSVSPAPTNENRAPVNQTNPRLTPSPLRSAMEDVMTSLQEMSLPAGSAPAAHSPDIDGDASPKIPWSPEEFDMQHARRREHLRGLETPPDHQIGREQGMCTSRPLSALGVSDAGFDVITSRQNSPTRERSPNHFRMKSDLPLDTGSICGSEHPGSLTPGPRGRSNTVTSNASRLMRPKSTLGFGGTLADPVASDRNNRPEVASSRASAALANRKSAYELGRGPSANRPNRNNSVTGSTTGSDILSATGSQYSAKHSLASGLSSGTGISATSAGSLARRRWTQGQSMPVVPPGYPQASMAQQTPAAEVTPPETSQEPTHQITHKASGIIYHNEYVEQSVPNTVSKRRSMAGGFLRKLLGGGRTIAASAREKTRSRSRPGSRLAGFVKGTGNSPAMSNTESGVSSLTYQTASTPNPSSGETDWIAVRRDVNRTNSISHNERAERAERCAMHDVPVIAPLEWLESYEGDEGSDGLPVNDPAEYPTNSLTLVDRTVRAMNVPWTSIPGNRNSIFGMPVPAPTVSGFTIAQLCRPFRSDVQRLRAIFCFIAERVRWEPGLGADIDESTDGDLSRVLQTGRATSGEMARLAAEMCLAVGIHASVVSGYLKRPSEPVLASELSTAADPVSGSLLLRDNHFWTTVLVGGEWRIMDCALASASNPARPQFSSLDVAARSGDSRPVAAGGHSLLQKAAGFSPVVNAQSLGSGSAADPFWFLARPFCVLYTHVPSDPAEQHIVPPLPSAVQLALPVACPAYFRHNLSLDPTFATSDTELLGLEVAQIKIKVPADVECVAEVRVSAIGMDGDGDRFETGDELCVAALCQSHWVENAQTGKLEKWFSVKAVLPGDDAGASLSGSGVLRVYAGKRGLMHSLRSNPHALALAVGLRHIGGDNPPLGFVVRHPTPQALRQDIYVVQPQCWKVQVGNTYVFAVRQNASDPYSCTFSAQSAGGAGGSSMTVGERRLARPSSIASIATVSNAGSTFSARSEDSGSEQGSQPVGTGNGWKPAKLAIQSPGGKIIRLFRRTDLGGNMTNPAMSMGLGGDHKPNWVSGTWETVIKVTERGTWRGLVLADRTARWCVWGEWECV